MVDLEATPERAWAARLYDGRSSAAIPVEIRLRPRGLEIASAGGFKGLWRYDSLRKTGGDWPSEALRIERRWGAFDALIVDDPTILPALEARAPGRFRSEWISWPRAILYAGGSILVAILVYLGFTRGLPPLAAHLVPVSMEERLGSSVVAALAPETDRCVNQPLRDAVGGIVHSLSRTAPRSGYRWRIYLAKGPLINAFAAPAGHIVIYQGMLELAEAPEEMAAVLAHEMQHVEQRHTTQALLAQYAALVPLLAVGSQSGMAGRAAEAGNLLIQLRYSRDAEAEADRKGIEMMARAGINPMAAVQMYERFRKLEQEAFAGPAYLATHPHMEERIQTLKRLAEQSSVARKRSPTLPSQAQWNRVSRACWAY